MGYEYQSNCNWGGRLTDMKANNNIDIVDRSKIHAGALLTTSHASTAIRTALSIAAAAILIMRPRMRRRAIELAIARSFNVCRLPNLGQMVGRLRAKLLHSWGGEEGELVRWWWEMGKWGF